MDAQEKEEIHREVEAEVKEKERIEKEKSKWLDYLSITTILIALCATLSTYNGGNYSSQSMYMQLQSSDQWAYYQGKSIKEYIYETQLDNLQVELLRNQPGLVSDSIKKDINKYSKEIEKYTTEKGQISKNARQMEVVRDEAAKHSSSFGLAVVFLEISILLSSIAALIKKRPIWYLSMVPGAIGIVYFINGFLLFF